MSPFLSLIYGSAQRFLGRALTTCLNTHCPLKIRTFSESVLDCVKTEPEDLTGGAGGTGSSPVAQRTNNQHLPLDVRVRGMGIVTTSPDGDSIILNRK